MDLKRLRYFCSVVEQGGVTKAAKALNMSQPPLSKRLHELEEEFGVALFVRNGRTIKPTQAGYHLYQKANELLRMVDDIVLEVVTIANTEQKEVRIGLSHLYQRYFKPFLIALHREQAGLDIKVVVSDSGYLERLLIERDLDFALIQHPADTGAFDCIDLKPVQLVAVAPKSMDEFSNCTSISMTQLLSREIIMLRRSSGSGTFEALQEQFRKQGISLNNTLTMSQPEAILDMLESGMNCVALLPDSEISPSHRTDCHVMKIEQAPLVFFPSIVKLTSTRFIHDVDRLIRDLEDYA